MHISIFPNPATGRITVSGLKPGSRLSIVDLLGREVFQEMAATEVANLDISGLHSGVYQLCCTQDAVSGQAKFVVR